jgi:hypothetical protein
MCLPMSLFIVRILNTRSLIVYDEPLVDPLILINTGPYSEHFFTDTMDSLISLSGSRPHPTESQASLAVCEGYFSMSNKAHLAKCGPCKLTLGPLEFGGPVWPHSLHMPRDDLCPLPSSNDQDRAQISHPHASDDGSLDSKEGDFPSQRGNRQRQ